MNVRIELYKAQNERLAIEQGLMEDITDQVSTPAANKIALMRMTTRPWAVRMMVYYVLFPQ